MQLKRSEREMEAGTAVRGAERRENARTQQRLLAFSLFSFPLSPSLPPSLLACLSGVESIRAAARALTANHSLTAAYRLRATERERESTRESSRERKKGGRGKHNSPLSCDTHLQTHAELFTLEHDRTQWHNVYLATLNLWLTVTSPKCEYTPFS